MTDFILYTIENDISPVGILLVVWYAKSMLDKSFNHSPLDFSNLVFIFLKVVLIGNFYLTICLKMTRQREIMGDGEVRAKLLESIVVELPSVV